MIKKNIYVVLCLVIVVFITALGYLVYLNYKGLSVLPSNLFTNLMNSNPAFSLGEKFFSDGNMNEALREYERALSFPQSKPEEAQIKNKIAAVKERLGDIAEAINISKEVVANESYGEIPRAYAAQFLGQLLFSVRPSAEKEYISKEIFKDSPYKELASTTDDSVSYRNLFDYASSIYPLALSELRSAYWYADKIFTLKQKSVLSTDDKEKIKEYLVVVSQKIKLADADISRVKQTENEDMVLPVSFIRKALVNTRILQAGETYDGMIMPENVYEEAISYLSTKGETNNEATVRYSYAIYLANRYGKDKGGQVKSLIGDFYNSERFATSSVMNVFRDEKANDDVTNKNIRLIASIDSGFKEFLGEKGWKF